MQRKAQQEWGEVWKSQTYVRMGLTRTLSVLRGTHARMANVPIALLSRKRTLWPFPSGYDDAARLFFVRHKQKGNGVTGVRATVVHCPLSNMMRCNLLRTHTQQENLGHLFLNQAHTPAPECRPEPLGSFVSGEPPHPCYSCLGHPGHVCRCL